jgi:hypothetical protein
MKVVYILSAQKVAVAYAPFKLSQRKVCRIRLRFRAIDAAF